MENMKFVYIVQNGMHTTRDTVNVNDRNNSGS